ncbi:MAG: KH domain-containing protein [Thermoproteota archaeon]
MSKANTFMKIPKRRIGALIGPEGSTKKNIEEDLSVNLAIQSDTGGVTIRLADDCPDPSSLFRAKEVVTAIGRGFPPETAFRLIRDPKTILKIIDLREIFGKSESDIRRIKGRIIGRGGKTRRLIEELTKTDVSIYGHTVGLIGDMEQMQAAKGAVQMLIEGSQHRTVYRYLHKKRRELKKRMLQLWEKPPDKKE